MSGSNSAWLIVQFLSTSSGQDKGCKTIQYFGKLAVWSIENFGGDILKKQTLVANLIQQMVETFQKIIKSLSTTRAVLRLSNIFKDVQTLSTGSKETNFTLWLLETSDMINSVIEDLVDWVIWGLKIDALKWNSRRWSYLSNLFWFIQLCFCSIGYIREWKNMKLNKDISKKALFNFRLNIIKLFADFCCCGPDTIIGKDYDGLMSFCGFISAVIGSYQLWDKLKSTSVIIPASPSLPLNPIQEEEVPLSATPHAHLDIETTKSSQQSSEPTKIKPPIPPERVVKRRDSLFFANK